MFKVRQFEAKTLSWWYSERENIDLDPPYQRRGGLWSKKDKAYLIDSIINEFDVPKIYIADFTYVNTTLNAANKPYAVIDGRQRLETIFEFFDGTLTLADDFEHMQDLSLQLGGLSYKDLKAKYPKIASVFDNFNLTVMSVITDEEGKINELFVRLNRSKPLTGAEVRHAMTGEVPGLIRSIANHRFFRKSIAFSVKRRQDSNSAAKLLLVEFRGKLVDTKKVNIDRFVEEGVKAESSGFEHAAERVSEILDTMVKVFTERDPLLRSQGPVTPYYWLVRAHPDKSDRIREFLVRFEQERRTNAQRANSPTMKEVDQELLNYDVMNRSTNDQASLIGRFAVLERRFIQFLRKKG